MSHRPSGDDLEKLPHAGNSTVGDADENVRKVTPPRPPPETGVAFFLAGAIQRLGHPSPGVRRVAAMDLARGTARAPEARAAGDALASAISAETDEPTLLALIRALATVGDDVHRPLLARLRDDPDSSPGAAHAALLAHDAIEGRSSLPP